jgi:hypothetical protein
MPDPKLLKIGDQVRFVSIPTEWSEPGYVVPRCDMLFIKRMIERTFPSRVREIDYLGYPWIRAILRHRGKTTYHYWMIAESTGWRQVNRRLSRQAR